MKKVVYCLLILLAGSFLTASAQTETGIFFNDVWTYVENASGLTLTDYRGNDTELKIPSELDGKPVTQLEKDLFMGNRQLRKVEIPSAVTVIGTNAFNGCTSLEEVLLPFSITSLASGTFRNCISLREINLPKGVRTIGSFAFANCRQLKNVYMMGVSTIGESAFDGCTELSSFIYSTRLSSVDAFAFRNTAWMEKQKKEFVTVGRGVLLQWNGSGTEVTVPSGVVRISGAFAENDKIEKVNLPDTLRVVGQYAFRNAVNLKEINIPIYTTTIGASAFEGCRSLINAELPKSVTSVGASAFQYCERLSRISIPEKVNTIRTRSFADCPSLKEVTIPESVTKIDKTSFQGSEKAVLNVSYGSYGDSYAKEYGIARQYEIRENEDFIYVRGDQGIHILKYTGNKAEVEIPGKIDGVPVTAVDEAAFQNNRCVRRIILPATLKSIGGRAFSNMDSLESIQIPAGLKSLGAYAFAGSAKLRQVRLPRRLQTIGEMPFDADSETEICLRENTEAADLLMNMGYVVYFDDLCPVIPEHLQFTGTADANSTCLSKQTAQNDAGEREILSIPEGIKTLTADMIRNAGKNLVLFIPASVESIEPDILDGRVMTIVSETGTAAEAFSAEQGIHFLVRSQIP